MIWLSPFLPMGTHPFSCGSTPFYGIETNFSHEDLGAALQGAHYSCFCCYGGVVFDSIFCSFELFFVFLFFVSSFCFVCCMNKF
ncbi:hypothetical protein CW304_16375 [Bacillus sp. UFRGS-B20]|nr:hypothetical protein CW304_16375 [Bacillus sp. UFRGS-B20]